jgi:diguanylate cyclase (GGDEF)-like protein/PAS domain S-box-containing protein
VSASPATRQAVAPIWAIQAALAEVRADKGTAGLRAALQHLADIREIATLCAGIHKVLGEILPAQNFSVVLRDDAGAGMAFAYHEDELEPAAHSVPQAHSLVHYVIRTNRSLLATPEVFNRLVAGGEVDPIEVPLAAWLGTPLSDGDHALGALVVKTYANGPHFGARELELLEMASRHVGQAVARRHSIEALEESEARFRALAENAPCAIFILQAGELWFANEAAHELTGYSIEDFEHHELWDVVHPDDRERVMQCGADLRGAQLPVRYVVNVLRKDGQQRWVDFSASVLTYRGRPAIMGVGLDITERKLADARIETLAYHDALTGLPNRRLLHDRMGVAMAQAHRRGKRLGVLYLDLDDFKDVNDSLGHQAGDELLKAVAERLARAMRGDDTVARVGGDEFVVLLTQIADATQAALIGQKILALLKAPVLVGERELFVNGSMGIAMYPEDGTDSESLLKNADAALYRAKERGRDNCQLYTLSLHTAAMTRLDMEGGLRRALERDELFLEYQPALDLVSDQVHGVEALLRWRHPVHGVLPPADFLPLAESSSVIVPMGWWVLVTACSQVRAWQQLGHPDLTVAVNIAARQFYDPGFVRHVTDVLAESGLRASCLELELTETQAMQNPEATARILTELSQLGVRISIDDFGTGYSSLSYLKRLPIHALKVDKSFVEGIATAAGDAAIATAIIRLAHTLNLSVQAEGVETSEQLEVLSQQACDRIQGFLYSKPLGIAACEAFLIRHRAPSAELAHFTAPQPASYPRGSRGPRARERHCIVMIEDSDEMRELFQVILTEAGYCVIGTGDPRRSLELVREHQPDLVLCDIAMPDMDGHDVVRALQADAGTAHVPVVFLTGRHELTERVRAFRFGVVDYLTKPIKPAVLTEKVARILSGIDQRRGAVQASGGDAALQLVAEVQHAGQKELPAVWGDDARRHLMLRPAAVLSPAGKLTVPIRADFGKLDWRPTQAVTNDPDAFLGAGLAPTFEAIQPGLREVLIAESDPLFRGFLRSVLEARGFLVHDAATGAEALRMALRHPPQIALLDVRMEGLDGFEICRRLRAHLATGNIPVVFLSGCQAYDERQRGMDAGWSQSVSIGSSVQDILCRMELLMKRYAQAGGPGPGGGGMNGAIEAIGAPGLLQMCHLGALTGALQATQEGRTVSMTFEIGRLATAGSNDAQGRDAVIQFLAWTTGRFTFQPGATAEGAPISEPMYFLILEACRILEEESTPILAGALREGRLDVSARY